MIYFLSDIHNRLDFKAFCDYVKEPHENDLLIILGDTELNFPNGDHYKEFAEMFLSVKCPMAIVDGNHENFDFLYSCPLERWNGGEVNRITENIVYLRRGNVYTLEGKTFFVFGGCRSSAKWREMGLFYPQQEATKEEYDLAYKTLSECGNKVDYVLSHKYSRDRNDPYLVEGLCTLTEYIDENVTFNNWYFGHTHAPGRIDEKHLCVYDTLIPII